jgi:hypothetical protein
MRVLVTGSRNWENWDLLNKVLTDVCAEQRNVTIVHGHCPTGADAMADWWGELAEVQVERHPANWKQWGKSAGFRRNAEMVLLGADVCVGFIRNKSRGATMTVDLATKAGIPVKVYRSNDGGVIDPW